MWACVIGKCAHEMGGMKQGMKDEKNATEANVSGVQKKSM